MMLGHADGRSVGVRASLPVAVTACWILASAGVASAQQDPNFAAPGDPGGPQVLARGPIHEAFASPISFNPTPGVVVPKPPPQTQIEEQPPAEKPVGADVEWIPGYWAWDDERSDYLWVSGVWRDIPPGRQWVPGYWSQADDGFRWTPGFWGSAAANGQFYYLPAPPPSQENGPNSPQPGENFAWAPGTWLWQADRYVWRPGYWFQSQQDWIWTPSSYASTPSGYVYNEGYWDYSLNRRGLAFAPVSFAPSVYSRPNYAYTPSYALPVAGLVSSLFVRPSYNSYYFGDYYGGGGGGLGGRSNYVPWFDYNRNRGGYDPLYSSMAASNARNGDWDRGIRQEYQNRVEHVEARPPATFAAQRPGSFGLAQPLRQWATNPEANHRIIPVAEDHRAELVRRQADFRDVAQARQRQEFEARGFHENRPNEFRPNEIHGNEIRSNEIRANENRANEIRSNEIRSNEIRANEIRANQNRANENRVNEIRANENRVNEIRANENRANLNRPNENRPEQFRPQRIELPRSPVAAATQPRFQSPGLGVPPAHPEQHQAFRPNFEGVPNRPMGPAPGQFRPENRPGNEPRPPQFQPAPGPGAAPGLPGVVPGVGQPMPPHPGGGQPAPPPRPGQGKGPKPGKPR